MTTNITGFAREVACQVHGFYDGNGYTYTITNKVGDIIGTINRRKGNPNLFVWNGEETMEVDNAGEAAEHIQYGPLFKECYY